MADRVIEELSEDQCLNLISGGGIGRIAYTGRFGPAVLPVNYVLQDGAVVFRTAAHGPLDEDLRTGITDADYKVAFEIDSIDLGTKRGWSVLIQGPAHHVAGQDVQVGAADRGRVDPNDRVAFVGDLRLGDFLPGPLAGAVVHERSHVCLLGRLAASSSLAAGMGKGEGPKVPPGRLKV